MPSPLEASADETCELVHFGERQPRGWFIEEEHFRTTEHRNSDLEDPKVAVRQVPRLLITVLLDHRQLVDELGGRGLGSHGAATTGGPSEREMFVDSEVGKNPRNLKASSDAGLRDAIGRAIPKRLSEQEDVAGVGRIVPADHVQHRGLARAIRTNEPDHLATPQIE